VLVQMPEPPPHWQRAFGGLSVRVRYLDAQGCLQEATGEDWSEPVQIVCSKEQNAPVLAYPLARVGLPQGTAIALPPAGGFFPLSLGTGDSSGVLSLAWEDGCAALAVWCVRSLDRDTSLFNAARLAREMRESEDPWGWDAISIAERIAGGDFSSYDIVRLPCRDLAVAPGGGEWFLESPFASVREANDGESILLAGVPSGQHTLFSTAGSRVGIFVSETLVVIGPVEGYARRRIRAPVSTRGPSAVMSTSFSHRTPPSAGS